MLVKAHPLKSLNLNRWLRPLAPPPVLLCSQCNANLNNFPPLKKSFLKKNPASISLIEKPNRNFYNYLIIVIKFVNASAVEKITRFAFSLFYSFLLFTEVKSNKGEISPLDSRFGDKISQNLSLRPTAPHSTHSSTLPLPGKEPTFFTSKFMVFYLHILF